MNDVAPKLADRLTGCAVLPPMTDGQHQDPTPNRRTVDGAKPPGGMTPAKGKPDRRRTRDRFGMLNAFLDFTAGALKRSELLVWLTLYRDSRDGIARTAQADLARRTGVSPRSVGLAIGQLERRSLLIVVHRGGLRRGPSSYRVQPLGKEP